MQSGTPENPMFAPTVFWLPNAECTQAMVSHAGFQRVELLASNPHIGAVVRAHSPTQAMGEKPDEMKAPWS